MKLADRYPTRFLREYVKWKVRMDPIYGSVLPRLPSNVAPLIDLGCGVGILPLVLREKGFRGPITGMDHDEGKIAVARAVSADLEAVDFIAADAREPLPRSGNVVLFDVLHYFRDEEQRQILANVAAALPAGGVAIIRDGLREPNLRYWLTYYGEVFARANGWLKAERLNFPRREVFETAFPAPRFTIESHRLAGLLPTNNFLFVVTRNA
jgi:SAM-dependent methyltransferase